MSPGSGVHGRRRGCRAVVLAAVQLVIVADRHDVEDVAGGVPLAARCVRSRRGSSIGVHGSRDPSARCPSGSRPSLPTDRRCRTSGARGSRSDPRLRPKPTRQGCSSSPPSRNRRSSGVDRGDRPHRGRRCRASCRRGSSCRAAGGDELAERLLPGQLREDRRSRTSTPGRRCRARSTSHPVAAVGDADGLRVPVRWGPASSRPTCRRPGGSPRAGGWG